MKLDNKGWGLNTLLVCIGIILVFLIVVVYYVYTLNLELSKKFDSSSNSNKTEIIEDNTQYYLEKEDKLEQAAKSYLEFYSIEISEETSLLVRYDELKKMQFIDNLNDVVDNSTCDGYVLADYKNGIYVTKGYIKCSNYTTIGYGDY